MLSSINPLVFHYSHIYNQDLPLASMVALGFYFLMLCDNFKNYKYSLWLGVIFGLGVLTKPTFIVYLFVPLMFCLYKPLKQLIIGSKKKEYSDTKYFNPKIVLNILLFGGFFMIIAWSWFGYKLKWILPKCYHEFYINKNIVK